MVRQADIVIKQLGIHIEVQDRKLALAASRELIRSTPILSGFARSNWILSLGSPHSGLAGSKLPNHRAANIDPSPQNAGIAKIQALGKTSGGRPKRIFLTNNTPYLNRLNSGSSTQAPAGFVQAAVARAVQSVP